MMEYVWMGTGWFIVYFKGNRQCRDRLCVCDEEMIFIRLMIIVEYLKF